MVKIGLPRVNEKCFAVPGAWLGDIASFTVDGNEMMVTVQRTDAFDPNVIEPRIVSKIISTIFKIRKLLFKADKSRIVNCVWISAVTQDIEAPNNANNNHTRNQSGFCCQY